MTEATLAPPAPAATVMEARAQLDARIADKDWGARLTAGDANTNREFHDLTAMVANEDDSTIAAAMSGAIGDMPDSSIKTMAATAEMFRNLGIRDEVTSQFLRGQQVTSEEYELVSNWRKEHMGTPNL
jgi:hypothetical protein